MRLTTLFAVLAALLFALPGRAANLSGISRPVEYDEVTSVPGSSVQFWINASGVMTRYDSNLGERLSLAPVWIDFSKSGTLITDELLKYFHGLDSDTSIVVAPSTIVQEGVYFPHDGLLTNFYAHHVSTTSAPSCTVDVHIAAEDMESERTTMQFIWDTDPRGSWADSTLKVYEGERMSVRWRGVNSEDVSFVSAYFYRDSTGAVTP